MSARPGSFAIGVDVGGTNIRAALVDAEGVIRARQVDATPYSGDTLAPPTELVEQVAACVERLTATTGLDLPVIGLGMGCGGRFDPQTGVLLGSTTWSADCDDFPMAKTLYERLQLPVFVDSDVKAAAYAELRVGAARAYRHVICVGVGTGIGGALIIDGALWHGSSGIAGHIGQIPAYDTGEFIEDVAGGTALSQSAIRGGVLQPGQTTKDLFALVRSTHSHSQAAQTLIDRAGACLGRALAGLVHTLEPEAVLMGGGVGVQPEYIAAVNQGLETCLMRNWSHIYAQPMQHGADAGQIGAALRVFVELDQGTW